METIGVFDSGVGGLSVLRAIAAQLPHEALHYVADSAHAPYGARDAAFIEARALALAGRLVDQGAKMLVVACNTASVVAVARLRERFAALPVVAMEPALKPAATLTKTGTVGVLATERTLASAAVQRLRQAHPQVRWLLQPCPGWVDAVERGDLDSAATQALVRQHVRPLVDAGADTLVLGCTHYPFLAACIAQAAGPGVTLVDPAPAVARQVAARLPRPATQAAPPRFASTGDPVHAGVLISRLWGHPVAVQAA